MRDQRIVRSFPRGLGELCRFIIILPKFGGKVSWTWQRRRKIANSTLVDWTSTQANTACNVHLKNMEKLRKVCFVRQCSDRCRLFGFQLDYRVVHSGGLAVPAIKTKVFLRSKLLKTYFVKCLTCDYSGFRGPNAERAGETAKGKLRLSSRQSLKPLYESFFLSLSFVWLFGLSIRFIYRQIGPILHA